MSNDTPWRARKRIDNKTKVTKYSNSLADLHKWISEQDHSQATEVVVEVWEHDAMRHTRHGSFYAKGRKVLELQDDADWVTFILCYEGKQRDLFAKFS